jgi:hypothetical protein
VYLEKIDPDPNFNSVFFFSQELGADPAGAGTAAQAERQQRHSLHQAGPRLPPLRQGVRPGLSRQIRSVGPRTLLSVA